MTKTKRLGVVLVLGMIASLVAGPAFAVSSTGWTGSKRHYSIYTTGDVTVSTFHIAPVGINTLTPATAVIVNAPQYQGNNGYEFYRVCYTVPYGTSPVACTQWWQYPDLYAPRNVINDFRANNGTGGVYLNILAKGDFTVEHWFPSLPAPIYSDPGRDVVTVNY